MLRAPFSARFTLFEKGCKAVVSEVDPSLPCLPLNAWCELHGEGLSGRCPRIRVGLLTSPEGKGADSTCSMWTPSSPYSTSSWMTSASLTPPNSDAPDRQPPSARANSSPWPSSLGGRGSPARGTSTAMARPISEQHSLLSQRAFPVQPSRAILCRGHRGDRREAGGDVGGRG